MTRPTSLLRRPAWPFSPTWARCSASPSPQERALPRLARLAVPELGDLCAIDLGQDDGTLARVAGAHVDPAKEALVSEVRVRHGFNPAAPAGVPAAMRARRPVLVARVTDADLMTEAQNADQLRIFQRLAPRSWMIVPLIGRESVLGAITLAITESIRRYDRHDLALAEAVARQAAVALEGARLRHDAEAARSTAESANRAKDEFLATLSHELRNPLNAMLGWARLLESGNLDEEQARRAIQIILRNVNAQVRLVDDLLDMSSVVSGRMRLSLQVVDLRDVIEEVLESVRPGAAAKGLRLHALLESPGAPISGDPDRLRQVVWNLLSNAVKFTPRGGSVEVKAQRVRSHAEIVVADTGQGIHADVLPYVFDRLRQGDSSTTRAHAGTGIGLALVRHLVELHGGNVLAESAGEGQGATFVVKLPLMVAEIREHPIAPQDTPSPGIVSLAGIRVLVVDDDPASVDLLVAMLVQAGAAARGSGLGGLRAAHHCAVASRCAPIGYRNARGGRLHSHPEGEGAAPGRRREDAGGGPHRLQSSGRPDQELPGGLQHPSVQAGRSRRVDRSHRQSWRDART